MTHYPIIDLHGDLLCYLNNGPERTPYDPQVRCSFPLLKAGNVKMQVLPIFTTTGPTSVVQGLQQFHHFTKLAPEGIALRLSIESASGFCTEDEALEQGFQRLEAMHSKSGGIVYISLTWKTENRFGGGDTATIGLKEDGKRLLDYLHGRQIAVDFSHASDALLTDTLAYIDQRQLDIPVIASHSNLRSISDYPRNLPEELAQEILRRQGIIGFNLCRDFIGPETPHNLMRQVDRYLELGAEKQLCFGADFFYSGDLPPGYRMPDEQIFFPEYADASCYPKVIDDLRRELKLSEETLQDIAWRNCEQFIKERTYESSII